MVTVVLLVVAGALVALVHAVATGRLAVDPLAPATHSAPDHGLPAGPAAADVESVRFDTEPRGYDEREVDARLDELRERLEHLERLEQDHRGGTAGPADSMLQPHEPREPHEPRTPATPRPDAGG